MEIQWFEIEGIDPIQWQVGVASAGRRGGRVVANRIPKPPELEAYQNAIAEYMDEEYPDQVRENMRQYPNGIRLEFWFEITDDGRKDRDATNLQKALEDALQGILYRNDREVVDIRTHQVRNSSGEPRITIGIGDADPFGGLRFTELGRSSW